mgnify:CR=1 FL=1
MKPLPILLALIWGTLWAVYLQYTQYGHYLAVRRTWVTVVIGVGVDLLIALLILPLDCWLNICTIIATSSLGIIIRSLYNERQDENAIEEINHHAC